MGSAVTDAWAGASAGRVAGRARVDAVDLVRGLVMIVMALDHTRDFFGFLGQNPTDLATTTAPLFFTRWITHFCAPVFFLLAGTGARLALARRSPRELAWFLLTRGAWLCVAEVTVAKWFAYQFNADYGATALLVLWAAGWSMITLAALVLLPPWVAPTLGLVLVLGHNLLDAARPAGGVWTLLLTPGIVVNAAGYTVFSSYPLLPWLGVTAVGYGLGGIYWWEAERRRRWLVAVGALCTAAFLVLRWVNGYGDPARWQPRDTPLFTALSFLNTTKYPPSLLFLLMTLGPALVVLGLVDGRTPRVLRPAIVFGRVPFFYYVLHFATIHALAAAVCLVRYGSAHWMTSSPDLAHFPFTAPPEWGYSLPVVYAVWISIVLLMFPVCRWFAGVKQRGGAGWLSYL